MIFDKNAFLNTDKDFFCLQIRLDIVVSVSINVYKDKFDIYQVDVTISFQISKNKLREKDIVLQLISQYKG